MKPFSKSEIPGFVIYKATVAFTQAVDLAGLAGGVTSLAKNLSGGVLPQDARYLGHTIGETFVGFTDGATGTYVLKIGAEADDDSVVATVNVANGQTGFPKAGTLGVQAFPMCPLASEMYKATITSNVNLNTATAGSVDVALFFAVRR